MVDVFIEMKLFIIYIVRVLLFANYYLLPCSIGQASPIAFQLLTNS